MSRVAELKDWYRAADERRDGSWAPEELVEAAVAEMVAAAEAQGQRLDPWDARVALKGEIDAYTSALYQQRMAVAREAMGVVDDSRPPRPMTEFAKQKAPGLRKRAERMVRDDGRWSYATLAAWSGVDRGTLTDWHKRGWVVLPPNPSAESKTRT